MGIEPIAAKEISIMKKQKQQQQYLDLLTSVDVLNTIHGGTSEPQMVLQQHQEGREIRIKVPGVRHDNIQVEIHNNVLSIFYFIPVLSNEKMVQMPCVVYNKNIPYYVDATRINSRLEDNALLVELPYNESANGYHRRIQIGEE
jgi:HSP20 family molecular chaperone IbpA